MNLQNQNILCIFAVNYFLVLYLNRILNLSRDVILLFPVKSMESIKMSNLEVNFMYEPSTAYVRSKYGGSTCHEKAVRTQDSP